MEGERKHEDKITCSREKQGAVVTSLKIPQLHRPDDPLNRSTIVVPHSRVMSWLCSPEWSRELFGNSVCDTEPQHILSIYHYRSPEEPQTSERSASSPSTWWIWPWCWPRKQFLLGHSLTSPLLCLLGLPQVFSISSFFLHLRELCGNYS